MKTKLTPKQFVETFYPYALTTQQKTGIDARFTLAQAALETGWAGRAPGNMFFGIKASANTPESKRQLLTTKEILSNPDARFPQIISISPLSGGRYQYVVKDWFRKYDTPEESFTDHAQLFLTNKRYAPAMHVRHEPHLFAQAVAKAGYATAPNYAQSLCAVIRTIENNL